MSRIADEILKVARLLTAFEGKWEPTPGSSGKSWRRDTGKKDDKGKRLYEYRYDKPEEETEKQPQERPQPKKKQKELKVAPRKPGEAPAHVQTRLKEMFGDDAKGFKSFGIDMKQLSGSTKITFVDRNGITSEKQYKDLSKEEKAALKEAIGDGRIAHTGFRNYKDVDQKTLQSNMDTNLSSFDSGGKIKTITSTDVVPSVPAGKKLTKENKEAIEKFKGEVQDSAKSIVKKYEGALRSPVSKEMLNRHVDAVADVIQQGMQDGSLEGVSQKAIGDLVQENIKRLLHQEVETKRRSLGDHGVRHAIGNAESSTSMLNELQKSGADVSAKDKLMAMTIQANHDLGYTLGEAATAFSGHQKNSKTIADSPEDQARYSAVFGEDGAKKIADTIYTHDTNEIDWKENPVESAVRLADISALFGEEKLQDAFIRSPGAMRAIYKMQTAADIGDGESWTRQKNNMHAMIEMDEGFSDEEKELLHQSVDEIGGYDEKTGEFTGFATSKDIMNRFSGRVKGFSFDPDEGTMSVHMKYSPEGAAIDDLFGTEMAKGKFAGFVGDLVPAKKIKKQIDALKENLEKAESDKEKKSIQEEINTLEKDVKDAEESVKKMKSQEVTEGSSEETTISRSGKPIVRLKVEGIDDNPINHTTNEMTQEFLKNSTRPAIVSALRALTDPPKDLVPTIPEGTSEDEIAKKMDNSDKEFDRAAEIAKKRIDAMEDAPFDEGQKKKLKQTIDEGIKKIKAERDPSKRKELFEEHKKTLRKFPLSSKEKKFMDSKDEVDIERVKKSKWFKGLSAEEQKKVEEAFKKGEVVVPGKFSSVTALIASEYAVAHSIWSGVRLADEDQGAGHVIVFDPKAWETSMTEKQTKSLADKIKTKIQQRMSSDNIAHELRAIARLLR